MSRLFKIALLWLIALSVPIQGAAAATMSLCGPIHQRVMMGQDKSHDTHTAHDHHHDAAMMKKSSNHHSEKEVLDFSTDKYSCSACAACCTSAAISEMGYRVPAFVPGTSIRTPSKESAFSGFIPDRPEHPPRHILV